MNNGFIKAEDPAEDTSPRREIVGLRSPPVCIAVFSVNLLCGFDSTIVADIQSPIAGDFEYTQLGWFKVGFTLRSVAFILPLGRTYAVFHTECFFSAA